MADVAPKDEKQHVAHGEDYDTESSKNVFEEVKLQRQLKNRHIAMIRYCILHPKYQFDNFLIPE
jgi:amino acid permease